MRRLRRLPSPAPAERGVDQSKLRAAKGQAEPSGLRCPALPNHPWRGRWLRSLMAKLDEIGQAPQRLAGEDFGQADPFLIHKLQFGHRFEQGNGSDLIALQANHVP